MKTLCWVFYVASWYKILLHWDVYNNSVPPWSKTLLERLVVVFLIRKFHAVYVTQRFICVFTRACQLSLSTCVHSHITMFFPWEVCTTCFMQCAMINPSNPLLDEEPLYVANEWQQFISLDCTHNMSLTSCSRLMKREIRSPIFWYRFIYCIKECVMHNLLILMRFIFSITQVICGEVDW